MRFEVVSKLLTFFKEGKWTINIDETRISVTFAPKKMWTIAKQSPTYHAQSRAKNYTIILATSPLFNYYFVTISSVN